MDSVTVGPPQGSPSDVLKNLLALGRRQTRNEGGALIDFVPTPAYEQALIDIDEAIALITAKATHTFNATPTTPYVLGDVWLDGNATSGHLMHRCTTARATGDYVAADWELLRIKADYVQADIELTSPIITGGEMTGGVVRTNPVGQSRVELSGLSLDIYVGIDAGTSGSISATQLGLALGGGSYGRDITTLDKLVPAGTMEVPDDIPIVFGQGAYRMRLITEGTGTATHLVARRSTDYGATWGAGTIVV